MSTIITAKDIEFIKEQFSKNHKLDFSYSWHHAVHTAQYIEDLSARYKEIGLPAIRPMIFAALGHDLLEDTPASQKEIIALWGKEALDYIKQLTNAQGDENFDTYIKRLKNAPEETLLIKYSDIYSNQINSLKNIKKLKKSWYGNFWIPLLDRYESELLNVGFIKYAKTAKKMKLDIFSNTKRIKEKAK